MKCKNCGGETYVSQEDRTVCSSCGAVAEPSTHTTDATATVADDGKTKSAGIVSLWPIAALILVFFVFFRGPDGIIRRYILPSVRVPAERNFWEILAGVEMAPSAEEDVNSRMRIAAGLGKVDEVKNLLEQGADANSAGPGTDEVPAGGTALMLAAAKNHPDIVDLLLENGANPNQADDGGGTALIYASWKGHLDIVRALLNRGADANAKTRDGRTPLAVARDFGHEDVAARLEYNGARD